MNSVYDRFYAFSRVRIILRPSHKLETFGSTIVNYHLLSELEDDPSRIRIREGRLEAHQPRIISPSSPEITVEGLGPQAREYLEFLRQNEDCFKILRYGYHLKSDRFSEQIVTDRMAVVAARVKQAVLERNDMFSAVLEGVDNPWDVAIVELWRQEVMRSAQKNFTDLRNSGKL